MPFVPSSSARALVHIQAQRASKGTGALRQARGRGQRRICLCVFSTRRSGSLASGRHIWRYVVVTRCISTRNQKLLVAPGTTTSNKDIATSNKGIATSSKDATSSYNVVLEECVSFENERPGTRVTGLATAAQPLQRCRCLRNSTCRRKGHGGSGSVLLALLYEFTFTHCS